MGNCPTLPRSQKQMYKHETDYYAVPDDLFDESVNFGEDATTGTERPIEKGIAAPAWLETPLESTSSPGAWGARLK